MDTWWYERNGRQMGPVGQADLAHLLTAGLLEPTTLVWTVDMPEWIPANKLSILMERMAEPPLLPRSIAGADAAKTYAIPNVAVPAADLTNGLVSGKVGTTVAPRIMGRSLAWRRYWAKSLDVLVAAAIAGVVVALLLPLGTDGGLPAIVFIVALVPCVEAALMATFGNSPGKAFLGLSVYAVNGKSMGFADHLRRNIRVAWFGLGGFFPPLALLAMIYQFRVVSRHGVAAYDVGRHGVFMREISKSRYTVAIVVVVAVLFAHNLLFALSSGRQENHTKQVHRADADADFGRSRFAVSNDGHMRNPA